MRATNPDPCMSHIGSGCNAIRQICLKNTNSEYSGQCRRQGTAALCSGLQQAGQAVKSNVTSAAEATVVPVPAFDSWFLRTSSAQMSPAIFDITTAVFGQKKSQGEQPTGTHAPLNFTGTALPGSCTVTERGLRSVVDQSLMALMC